VDEEFVDYLYAWESQLDLERFIFTKSGSFKNTQDYGGGLEKTYFEALKKVDASKIAGIYIIKRAELQKQYPATISTKSILDLKNRLKGFPKEWL